MLICWPFTPSLAWVELWKAFTSQQTFEEWFILHCIQLFHACLGNSQNDCPSMPWAARCTIARGRIELSMVPRVSRFVYSAKQPWNNCFKTQPVLKIPVFLPRNAGLIDTRRRYIQFTSWRSTSFSWCLTPSTRQQTKLLPAAFPLLLNKWRDRRGIVDSMDRLMILYEWRYVYVAAARIN